MILSISILSSAIIIIVAMAAIEIIRNGDQPVTDHHWIAAGILISFLVLLIYMIAT